MRNTKSQEFPKEKCKIMLDRLVNKFVPNTASSLLKMTNESHNSQLNSVEKDPDEWILNLKGL